MRVPARLLITATIAAAVLVPVATSSASARSATACGELGRMGEMGPGIVTASASGVGCRVARAALEEYLLGSIPKGWECHSAGEEGSCLRGEEAITYRAARRVKSCGSIGFEPNSENGAGSIKGRGTSCRIARKVARAARFAGPSHPSPYRVAGFSCAGQAIAGVLPAALYVCHRQRATVVFVRT